MNRIIQSTYDFLDHDKEPTHFIFMVTNLRSLLFRRTIRVRINYAGNILLDKNNAIILRYKTLTRDAKLFTWCYNVAES